MHRCSICRHPHKTAIEHRLAAGDSLRRVAQQFQTSPWALHRHQQRSKVEKSSRQQAVVLQEALARLQEAHMAMKWSNPMSIVAVLKALVQVVGLLAQAQHRL
jgi:hypothetical protein